MRKEIFRMDRGEAIALLARAPAITLASTTTAGAPILRTVNAVVVDDAVCFHGAPAGEKIDALGREAVLQAEETIASIPSYFVDPERACPATTLYRSVQVHGRLEEVRDRDAKARVMRALLAKLQPEGGHVPIEAEHPLYAKALEGLLVVRVALDRIDGKAKAAQNRTPRERTRILERLWERGAPGDARAIEAIRAHAPDTPAPAFLAPPPRAPEATMCCALGDRDVASAVDLLAGEYWNVSLPRDALAGALLGSDAWVGARGPAGEVVAHARAISDRAKTAWIFDVCVAPAWRRRGLGEAVMRLVLDHPAVRRARVVRLGTRDAQRLYERFGFADLRDVPLRSYPSIEMALRRP